jgi:hypothetical protein
MAELDDGRRGWLGGLLRPRVADHGTRVLAFPPPVAVAAAAAPQAASYRGNRTSTTKYTLLSFLPKSLFEQYRCVARGRRLVSGRSQQLQGWPARSSPCR